MSILSVTELDKNTKKEIKQHYYNLNNIISLSGEGINLTSESSELEMIKNMLSDENVSFEEIQESVSEQEDKIASNVSLSINMGDMAKEDYFPLAKIELLKL